jgi:uncharacterized protein YqjF (DUF2071 family)
MYRAMARRPLIRQTTAGGFLRGPARACVDACERGLRPTAALVDEIAEQPRTLEERSHRPWPLPDRPWLMAQTWNHLLFAHWEVPRAHMERLLPPALELDLYDGTAWLGVTPFVITGARVRGTPPLPWLSSFPELNVRTYVRVDGRPGIWFLSLDAARVAAVAGARVTYRLPYYHAAMRAPLRGDVVRYESHRTGSREASFRADYGPAGPELERVDGTLERWLAERYCAFVVDDRGRPWEVDIHHRPWPLQPATAHIEANSMGRPLGLDLSGPPLLHYSRRQDTLIWSPEPVHGGAHAG